MTEQQKKMKKYVNAIRRNLNMPGEVKKRVMNDLICSIDARREAGQTDEEIYAELGLPKKVAEELNVQMGDYGYVKSPWRYACLALSILSGLVLLVNGLEALLTWTLFSFAAGETASVGIIGGADGPTAIFVTSSIEPLSAGGKALLARVCLVGGILGFRRLCRCRKK